MRSVKQTCVFFKRLTDWFFVFVFLFFFKAKPVIMCDLNVMMFRHERHKVGLVVGENQARMDCMLKKIYSYSFTG